MKPRQLALIQILLEAPSHTSVQDLQESLGVSLRTLRYDLAEIKKIFKKKNWKLEMGRGKGYFIPFIFREEIADVLNPSVVKNTQEDMNRLFLLLSLSDQAFSVMELSDQLFLSEKQVRDSLKNIMAKYPSMIEEKRGAWSIRGEEIKIRKESSNFLLSMIVNQTRLDSFIQELPASLGDYIPKALLKKIDQELRAFFRKKGLWISPRSLLWHTAYLMMTAIRNARHPASEKEAEEIQGFYELDEELHVLLNACHVQNHVETEGQILKRLLFEDSSFVLETNGQDTELLALVIEMEQELTTHFPELIFNQEEFSEDIYKHLESFIQKTQAGIHLSKNPLLENIKKDYAQYFLAASQIACLIPKHFPHVRMTDSEISYIAIYLYKAQQSTRPQRHKVITVCATGKGLAKLMNVRLKHLFPNLEILASVSAYQLADPKVIREADLILTSVSVPESDRPVIRISPFVTEEDIQRIMAYLRFGRSERSMPFSLEEVIRRERGEDLLKDSKNFGRFAEQYASLFLDLYELVEIMTKTASISVEELMSLTTHLILAMPRYFETETMVENQCVRTQLRNYQSNRHNQAIGQWLDQLEEKLGVTLSESEKLAYYYYLGEEEGWNNS